MGILERFTAGIIRRMTRDIAGIVMLEPAEPTVYEVAMRDGVMLKTRVYTPNDRGGYPIIFARSPYYNEFSIYDALFRQVTRLGFVVCYQSCRGTGGSDGIFEPFVNERNDWFDTIDWIKGALDTSRGIGLYGASYLAFNHIVTADSWPPEVRTAFLAVFGDSLYDVFYRNGALKESFTLNWFLQNNGVKDVHYLKSGAFFSRSRKIIDKSSVLSDILDVRCKGYDKVISGYLRDGGNSDWELVNHGLKYIDVPVCLISGWYDFASAGQMRLFEGLKPTVRSRSRLILGPWNHMLIAYGDYRTPKANEGGIQGIKYALEWFIRQFYQNDEDKPDKALDSGPAREDTDDTLTDCGVETHNTDVDSLTKDEAQAESAIISTIRTSAVTDGGTSDPCFKSVRYYSIGEGFIESDSIPATECERMYLSDGILAPEPGEGWDTYIFNPVRPSATAGGGSTYPDIIPLAGRPKQWTAKQAVSFRKDTLTYISDVFSEEVRFFGPFVISLDVDSDCSDTMFYAKICLLEDGGEYHMCDGVTTLFSAAGGVEIKGRRVIRFETNPVAFCIKPGACLTLHVTSSDYPAYSVHTNESTDYLHSKTRRKARNTVYYGENSYIELRYII